MRIAINALSLKVGGGLTFLNNLVPSLLKYDSNTQYYLFIAQDNKSANSLCSMPDKRIKVIRIKTYNVLVRLFIEQFILPYFILREKIDILMCSGNISSFFMPCKKLLWILNISPFTTIDMVRESLYCQLRNILLRILTILSIRSSSLTIFISNYSMLIAAQMIRIDPKRAKVIHLGVSSEYGKDRQDIKKRGAGNYILSVSTISERKNYEVLLRSYAGLRSDILNKYKLILVGKVTDKYKQHLLSLVKNEKTASNIIFTGQVDGEELYKYYTNAALFVMPSLVESFGLPVIEAMASGLPVIVSNATSLPEIAGKAGIVFDPYNPHELGQKIEWLLSDQEIAGKYAKLGIERAAHFTWDNTARETINCFEAMMKT